MPSRFELGNCYITPGAAAALAALAISPTVLLQRHATGDAGILTSEDIRANERAILVGSRILSAFIFNGQRIWVITDAVEDDGHRHSTTILLASEY